MNRSRFTWSLAAAGVAVLGITTQAGAGTLSTSMLYKGDSQYAVVCIATNTGAADLKDVAARLVNDAGVVVEVSCPTLAPGTACQALATTSAAFCQIDFTGSKKSIRGAGSVMSNIDSSIAVVEPAR